MLHIRKKLLALKFMKNITNVETNEPIIDIVLLKSSTICNNNSIPCMMCVDMRAIGLSHKSVIKTR